MRNSAQARKFLIGGAGAVVILIAVLVFTNFKDKGQDYSAPTVQANQSENADQDRSEVLLSQNSEPENRQVSESLHTEESEEQGGQNGNRQNRASTRNPDALPEETLWLSRSGQVDSSELRELLSDGSFESALDDLEASAFEDPDAYEFTAVYSDFLDSYIQGIGGEDFNLNGFACGLRTCIGQIARAGGSESDWIKLGQLGTSSDGPPVYMVYDQQVTTENEWGGESAVHRFFISIDPDTNSFEFP